MKSKVLKAAASVSAIVLLASSAHADILAGWEVTGVDVADGTGIDTNVSPYSFTSTNLGAGIQSAVLSLSSAVNPSTAGNAYGFKVSTTQTNLEGAITSGDFLQFTLTAASGFELNLTSIEMHGQSTSTGADSAAMMSDIDGFIAGNEIALVTNKADVTGGFDTDGSGWGGPISLAASQYQGVSEVTFRFYGYGTTSGSGSTYIRSLSGDDLVINGTVSAVIPEPASLGLFLFGAAVSFTFRRFRSTV